MEDNPSFVLNGQGPLLLLAPQPSQGGLTTGADVRQSRFNASASGPKVFGATPRAFVEMDFFGLNAPGGYGEVSAYPRLRLAYAELKWENDLIRFGQDHELIIGLIPEGLGHMAYPVTYFNGLIGWREPGIGYFHTMPVGDGKLELGLQVIKSDWQNPTDFGQPTTNDLDVDLGQLSGLPGVEARVKYSSENVMAFIAGHWNHVQSSHAGEEPIAYPFAAANRNFEVVAGTAAVKLTAGPFSALANAYVGQNLGPFLGEQLNFFTSADVFEYGGWLQLLYSIIPELNVSVIGGTSQLDKNDAVSAASGDAGLLKAAGIAGTRVSSAVLGGMVRLQEGGFGIGPEFYHVFASQLTGTGTNTTNLDGNQFMLSGMYFF